MPEEQRNYVEPRNCGCGGNGCCGNNGGLFGGLFGGSGCGCGGNNSEILFFLIIFLLLFTNNR